MTINVGELKNISLFQSLTVNSISRRTQKLLLYSLSTHMELRKLRNASSLENSQREHITLTPRLLIAFVLILASSHLI